MLLVDNIKLWKVVFMQDIIDLITNNGIGIVCVAYLIYFQSTTMKEMLNALSNINIRLSVIEDNLDIKKG